MKIGLGIGIPATSSGMSILQQLQNIPGGGLTFFKDYRPNASSLNADFSVGSNAATYTAARSESAPSMYTDSNGIIQLLTTADVRRWKGGYYDATGFHLQSGEMIEAAGTNLFLCGLINSSVLADTDGFYISTTKYINVQYSNSGASTNSISTDSVSYGGRSIQIEITNAGTVGASDIMAGNSTTINLTNGTVYTLSFYAKASTNKTISVLSLNGDTGLNQTADITTSWARYSLTWTANATAGTNIRFYLGNNGLYTINFESIQLEASPYATSFIPTTTAALTRAAEVLKYATSGNRTAASETIYLKVSQIYSGSEVTGYPPVMTTDTKERKIYISKDTDSYQFEPNATDSSSCDVASSTDPTKNVSYVLAVVAHGETSDVNASIYVNGSLENTDSDNYTSPGWGTYMYFGSGAASTGQSGILLQSVAIYSGAHDAATVAAVTNILNAGGL